LNVRTACIFLLWIAVGALHAQTAETLIDQARYEEALARIDADLQAKPDDSKALLQKAEVLVRLGRFQAAAEMLAGLTPATAGGRLFTLKGFLYLNQGRTDLALEEVNKALNEFQRQSQSESLQAAEAMAVLSSAYLQLGRTAQAEEQMQEALSIRKKLLPERSELIAASYNDLGLVQLSADPEKALDYYEAALTLYQELHGEDHPKVAIAHTNMGIAYRQIKLYGDAVNDFEQALAIWNKIYTGSHPAKGFVQYNLGLTYRAMGNRQAAKRYYEEALKIFLASYGGRHPELARVWNSMGELLLSESNYDSSLWAYSQAIVANAGTSSGDQEVHINSSASSFDDGFVLLNSLNGKALAWEERHFGRSLKQRDLERSLAALHGADTLVDLLRQQINRESDKISLSANAQLVYSNAVRVSYQLSITAVKNRKHYAALAFYFAEKSKSAVLQDAIADTHAKAFANIPDSVLQRELDLKAGLALATQKLAQKPGGDAEQLLRQQLYQLNNQYQRFVSALEKNYPQYYQLKFSRSATTVQQVQKMLQENEALLSYFIDEAKGRLFIFVVTPEYYRIYNRTLSPQFERNMIGLRNSLQFQEPVTFNLIAGALGRLLIPRIPPAVNRLIIVPAGRLSIIPFEVLPLRKHKSATFAGYPYLLRKYATSYHFSAGLVAPAATAAVAETKALMCAPIEFANTSLGALPATEQEVERISASLTSQQFEVVRFVRNQASEAMLKSPVLAQYGIVHLATHGVVDEVHPELSRIFLSTTDREDGELFSGEIYNLRLNAQLVTLSACETGLGKISRGEGVIGLSRALLYAGAKNLVVSYWRVADESTAQLMTHFYQPAHTRSYSYAEALRQAKLRLIKEYPQVTPYYWAPFVLIGRD